MQTFDIVTGSREPDDYEIRDALQGIWGEDLPDEYEVIEWNGPWLVDDDAFGFEVLVEGVIEDRGSDET